MTKKQPRLAFRSNYLMVRWSILRSSIRMVFTVRRREADTPLLPKMPAAVDICRADSLQIRERQL
jgi:hypothetical protein